MQRIRQRLTYANVMSSIAVFLVLGGGAAYAAKKVGSNEIKGNSITTGKLKREAVTRGKIKKASINSSRLSESAVTTVKIANDAVTGDKVKESTLSEVPRASLAVTAESAQPAAFGQITANGSVEVVNSKNVVKAERIGEGEYCVTANFSPRGGQVTPIFAGTGGTTAQLNLNSPDCPAPAVRVFTYSAGTSKGDLPFFIHLYH